MAALRIEDVAEGVRLLTFDNEAKRNAVDPEMLAAIPGVCAAADADGVRCLVLTGAGEKAFCSGYDLNRLQASPDGDPLPDAVLHLAVTALEHLQAPVIAAVNGAAYGAGAELAAACDLRVAARNARLSMPPARLGIVYAPAGLERFVELVGLSQAKRLFFTGEAVQAEEALAIGLVDEMVEEGQALRRALELASTIAGNAPLAVQGMKRLFRLMRQREIPQAVLGEVEALRRASFASEDAREGVAAVFEKRKPRFTGR